MANLLSLEGCGGEIGAAECSRERVCHCKDRKESEMAQSVTNSVWRGEGFGEGVGEALCLALYARLMWTGMSERGLGEWDTREGFSGHNSVRRESGGWRVGGCQALGSCEY